MTDKLNWGYDRYDFGSIQETIFHYFPIENPSQFNEESIQDFRGVKEIGEILNDHFLNDKNYKERWGKFKMFLKKEIKEPIYESLIAFYPCYSGILTLKRVKNKNLIYTKELHFFISLLGPYYTIVGVDKSEISLEEVFSRLGAGDELATRPFAANLALTVSPYLEYKESFLLLQEKILKYFPTLKFVPYTIGIRKVEGISLIYSDSEREIKDSVFSALFRPDDSFNSEVRGDIRFGFDEWLKVKKLDRRRMIEIRESLLKKSLEYGSKFTVHKVWKFKTVNQIPTRAVTGIFGTSLVKVLDLTESNYATLIFEEDEEPIRSSYSIIGNEIIVTFFEGKIGFRIERMTDVELSVILHVAIISKEQMAFKGDVSEIIFEEYK